MEFTTASASGRKGFGTNKLLTAITVVFLLFWSYTFWITTDRANWFTENALTTLLLLVLAFTYRKFRFSDMSYFLIFAFLLMHVYGSAYTYAENPIGYWLKDILNWKRNHYDRLVHLCFGLLLTYPMRDYFRNWFKWPAWVCWVLPVEITMSFSAAYELLEWLVADVFFKEEGIAYLGTQGDVWDAQKDMGLAFLGAVFSMSSGFALHKLSGKPEN